MTHCPIHQEPMTVEIYYGGEGPECCACADDPRVGAIQQWLEEAMVRLSSPGSGIRRLLDLLDEAGDVPPPAETRKRPEIVCLCGSTRFKAEFEQASRQLGLAGKIVLSVSMFGHSGDLTPEQCTDGHPTKTALDELHKRKIDLADQVLVINPGGYIGTSTRSEIAYAEAHGKPVSYSDLPVAAPPPAQTEKAVDLGWFSSPASLLSPEVIAEVVAQPKCICDGASYRTAEENATRQPFIVAANCPVRPVAASSPTPTEGFTAATEKGYTHDESRMPPHRLDPDPRTAEPSPTHERTVLHGPWRALYPARGDRT